MLNDGKSSPYNTSFLKYYFKKRKRSHLCEILFADTKTVLLNIIKIITSIYFLHTFTYAITKLVLSTDLVSWKPFIVSTFRLFLSQHAGLQGSSILCSNFRPFAFRYPDLFVAIRFFYILINTSPTILRITLFSFFL